MINHALLSSCSTCLTNLRVVLLLLGLSVLRAPLVEAQFPRPLSQQELDKLQRGRHDSSEYLGMRITYEFAYTRMPEPRELWVFDGFEAQVSEGIRVLEIGKPISGSNAIPFRITHTIENRGEPLVDEDRIVSYWEAFNGSETRIFTRALYYGKCRSPGEHTAQILPGCHPQVRGTDPLYLFLFEGSIEASHLNGDMPPQFRSYGGDVEEIVSQIDGVDTLFRYPDGGLRTGPPESLIVSFSETDGHSVSVSDFQKHQGVLFPGSGHKENPGWAAQIELLSVERIDENPKSWFFEFPSGTTVINTITGETVRNPYTASEVREIKLVTAPFCPGYISASTWPKALFLVLNLAAIAAIIVFFYKRSTRGGRAEAG